MSYKKIVNIILRCGIYVFVFSRITNENINLNIIYEIWAVKTFFDFALIELMGIFIKISEQLFNILETVILIFNFIFFAYFYAKLCGLYKLFEKYRFWQKFLIFSLLSVLIYPVAMFDFKNFKIFDNFYLDSNNEAIILTCFFVLPAFFLNLFFNFLTKKFPKPFEKIGYWCSLEFFKSLIKNR